MQNWCCVKQLFVVGGLFFGMLPPGVAAPQDGWRVGALLPLTGSFAAVGEDNRQGIEVALQELRAEGQLLHISYGDSRAEGSVSVQEFRKFTDVEKVEAVFAMRSPVGMAVNPLSRAQRVPLLGGVGHKDFAASNPYAFQAWPRSDDEGAFLAHHVLAQGYKRIALLTLEDEWTSALSAGFEEAFLKGKGVLEINDRIPPAEMDFRVFATRAGARKVEALVINVGLAQLGPALKQTRELGLEAPIFSNFWVGKPEVREAAGKHGVEGVMFAEMSTDMPALRKALLERFGSVPSGATLAAYVSTLWVGQAARTAGATGSREQLYEALRKVTEVRAQDRTFQVRDRVVQFPMSLRTIRDGVVRDSDHE